MLVAPGVTLSSFHMLVQLVCVNLTSRVSCLDGVRGPCRPPALEVLVLILTCSVDVT